MNELQEKDTYKTINSPSEEVLFKDKNSKFFGYCFPLNSEEDVKEIIVELKKKHHSARHWCYAFQLGVDKIHYRLNDDGEPNNSAGAPIYGQIKSFDLTNILVVVVRYFGGVKLGVSGLINAYKTSAQLAIENCTIIEKTIDYNYFIDFDYKNMNKVMRIIKENNLSIVNQKLELNCQIEISVRKKDAEKIYALFESLFEIKISSK